MLSLSQAEVARQAGHSRSYICQVERGRAPISRNKLAELFTKLGLDSNHIDTCLRVPISELRMSFLAYGSGDYELLLKRHGIYIPYACVRKASPEFSYFQTEPPWHCFASAFFSQPGTSNLYVLLFHTCPTEPGYDGVHLYRQSFISPLRATDKSCTPKNLEAFLERLHDDSYLKSFKGIPKSPAEVFASAADYWHLVKVIMRRMQQMQREMQMFCASGQPEFVASHFAFQQVLQMPVLESWRGNAPPPDFSFPAALGDLPIEHRFLGYERPHYRI